MPFALVDFSSRSSSSKSVIHHDQQLSGFGTPRPWPCVVSSCHPMMKRSVLCRASQKQMSVGNIDKVLMGEGGTIFFMLVSERKRTTVTLQATVASPDPERISRTLIRHTFGFRLICILFHLTSDLLRNPFS